MLKIEYYVNVKTLLPATPSTPAESQTRRFVSEVYLMRMPISGSVPSVKGDILAALDISLYDFPGQK